MAFEPISLYLQIDEGESPDIEVVGRASIAFSQAIKEIAYIIDPSMEIDVGFSSGTRGSLKLNSLIRATGRKIERNKLLAITLAVLLWFSRDIAQYGVSGALDQIFKSPTVKLSEEDIQKVAAAVKEAMERKVGERKVQKVFQELHRDKTIKGVGATATPDATPHAIIPRDDFALYGGFAEETLVPLGPTSRVRTAPVRVRLISPVLATSRRKWRFSSPEGEFLAALLDFVFLENMLSGRNVIAMRAGIEMDVMLQTSEEFENGVWVVKKRDIIHVIDVHAPPIQLPLV